MKKLVAVPVVAIIAAAGAASAAGFAGGVSAGPLQTGQTSDLECATVGRGRRVGLRRPRAHARSWTTSASSSRARTAATRPSTSSSSAPQGGQQRPCAPAAASRNRTRGTQYVRVPFNGQVDAEQLKSIRISIDPGFSGQEYGTIG